MKLKLKTLNLEEIEKQALNKAIKISKTNLEVSKLLGVSERTVYRLFLKWNIELYKKVKIK